jgi:hypothetical protein
MDTANSGLLLEKSNAQEGKAAKKENSLPPGLGGYYAEGMPRWRFETQLRKTGLYVTLF